jgi:DNA-binding XRE family transcriptional regulator
MTPTGRSTGGSTAFPSRRPGSSSRPIRFQGSVRFVGLTQGQFALAMGISVHTLRNWEQGRRHPEGPAIALLRIAARHPRIIRENVENVAA